jgi:hypothetical protein
MNMVAGGRKRIRRTAGRGRVVSGYVLAAVLLVLSGCGRAPVPPSRYDLKVDLKPAERSVGVHLDLAIDPSLASDGVLKFYLHRQFGIRRLSGAHVTGFVFDKDHGSGVGLLPSAGVLRVTLDGKASGRRPLRLSMDYSGTLTDITEWSANAMGPDWVELGLYLPWFPYNPDYGRLVFGIEARCDPGYGLCSYGPAAREGGTWRFRRDSPTTDIVLAAAPGLKTLARNEGGQALLVSTVTLGEATAESLSNDLLGVLKLYRRWFGATDDRELTLMESRREKGGGYARRGFIALSGLSDDGYASRREGYLRYLAHEAAHIWWNAAPVNVWEDWLNEGLAEYSALLAVRELFGTDAFDKRLAKKEEDAKGAPPIWGLDRNDVATEDKAAVVENVLYSKGPVLLHRLSERIGEERFLDLCREAAGLKSLSTGTFLRILAEKAGRPAADWFESELKAAT